ncbi:Retrovirus-related Pol polyprotein from type-2 retrotransposable element R2DM [Armadillidium nasatum]|uniref:Retrovirus-related Pol polyprotein from type-2 retrotransposable element R2DM n=1 Tax=Armadillidium nasatum TaxID=96803 RepID=A0A5N5TEK3_9CRUS|nr:Retrovirus-related Pol polyprotein from type-2 retrotransposable element R2DM [Armadillidium nasatum]
MEIPVVKGDDIYKYLGVKIGRKGPTWLIGGELRDSLQKVAGAALKPQQKMYKKYLNKKYLPPKYYYQLVHQRVIVMTLRSMEKCIRSTVRRILHLPHDTPTPMFHEHPSAGGLAVPELEKVVPALLAGFKSRMEARGGFWNEVANAIKIPHCNRVRRVKVTDFCDGKGLGEASKQPACYKWLFDGSRLMSGSTFIEAVKIRHGLVATKEKSSRGNRAQQMVNLTCDLGCRKIETLGHILQECPHTAHLRNERHDQVNLLLKTALEKKGYTSILEPTIATAAGIRRPDIVCWKADSAHVIDTTICADAHAARMEDVFQRKVDYYRNEDINTWVRRQSGTGAVATDALVMNWRGDPCRHSHKLLARLRLLDTIKLMEVRSLEYSVRIARFFKQAAGHWG